MPIWRRGLGGSKTATESHACGQTMDSSTGGNHDVPWRLHQFPTPTAIAHCPSSHVQAAGRHAARRCASCFACHVLRALQLTPIPLASNVSRMSGTRIGMPFSNATLPALHDTRRSQSCPLSGSPVLNFSRCAGCHGLQHHADSRRAPPEVARHLGRIVDAQPSSHMARLYLVRHASRPSGADALCPRPSPTSPSSRPTSMTITSASHPCPRLALGHASSRWQSLSSHRLVPERRNAIISGSPVCGSTTPRSAALALKAARLHCVSTDDRHSNPSHDATHPTGRPTSPPSAQAF